MTKKRNLEINGQEVEVSEEVYKEYMRPIWREDKSVYRAYKNLEKLKKQDGIKTEAQKNGNYIQVGSLETGFSKTKEYGLPLSLDLAEEVGFQVVSSQNIENMITYKLLEEAFLDSIKDLSDRDREIFKFIFLYEMTEREIAEIVGVSQKTVNNIKRRHLPMVQRKMKPWKD